MKVVLRGICKVNNHKLFVITLIRSTHEYMNIYEKQRSKVGGGGGEIKLPINTRSFPYYY